MKAITVTPLKQGTLRLQEQEVPRPAKNEMLLQVQKIGICGTDRDIIAGFYGEAPAGESFLVLGHESLSRVFELGTSTHGFKKGDLVVPTVRRNCPENCPSCKSGQSDMCLTGHYFEHGIKGLHGFAREFAITDSSFVVKLPESLKDVGVLLEPLTIVEKGLTQTFLLQDARMKKSIWKPKKALVLGAGPVGLLATALLRLKNLEVDTVATRAEESLKARLVEQTGAKYINSKITPISALESSYDIVFEVTGNTLVGLEAQNLTRVNGAVCYLGVYKQEQESEDAGKIFTNLVLGNRIQFGSVNANKSYFVQGAKHLLQMRKMWSGLLEKMITNRMGCEDLQGAYTPKSQEEIKTVIEFGK
ncbi:MAG: glucose 1-dehydrogenase [Nitrososphaerales archaeon]